MQSPAILRTFGGGLVAIFSSFQFIFDLVPIRGVCYYDLIHAPYCGHAFAAHITPLEPRPQHVRATTMLAYCVIWRAHSSINTPVSISAETMPPG